MQSDPAFLQPGEIKVRAGPDVVDFPVLGVVAPSHGGGELPFQVGSQLGSGVEDHVLADRELFAAGLPNEIRQSRAQVVPDADPRSLALAAFINWFRRAFFLALLRWYQLRLDAFARW